MMMQRLAARLLASSLSPASVSRSSSGTGTSSSSGEVAEADRTVTAADLNASLTAAAIESGLPERLPAVAEAPIAGVGGVPGPQLWLETLRVQSDVKLGLVSLDPRIFHQLPRPQVLHQNLQWQGLYRLIDYRSITYKTEVTRGHRKPWPQKGFGRARHGDRLAPQFFGGCQVKGPRGPEAYFHLIPQHLKVSGLVSALSARCLQDDLHIVDSLDIPEDSGVWLQELVTSRGWGTTVLFVSESGTAPLNMALACDSVRYFSLMPYYGINVWSLLKHDTLVMTLAAAKKVQERLLDHLAKTDNRGPCNPDWDEPQATHFTGHSHPDRVGPPRNVYY